LIRNASNPAVPARHQYQTITATHGRVIQHLELY
jgi:hypothetical protein